MQQQSNRNGVGDKAHPGAAVYEGARDPQHVCILCEF